MSRKRTWEVLEMGVGFYPSGVMELICPNCGNDAELPFRDWPENPVIGSIGLGLIFDKPWLKPPVEMLPCTIRCRRCGSIFTSKKKEEVPK